jgi:hypothetical protein
MGVKYNNTDGFLIQDKNLKLKERIDGNLITKVKVGLNGELNAKNIIQSGRIHGFIVEDAFEKYIGTDLCINDIDGFQITNFNVNHLIYIGNGLVYISRYDNGYKHVVIKVPDTGIISNYELVYDNLDAVATEYIGNNIVLLGYSADLYKNNINELNNETLFLSNAVEPLYIGNDEMLYNNGEDNNYLYKKSTLDTNRGTLVSTLDCEHMTYIGNNEIVFSNYSDSKKLYKMNIDDGTNVKLTDGVSYYATYIGNRKVVYCPLAYNYKIYVRDVDDETIHYGTQITTHEASSICYIGNGNIVYRNASNDYLYKKKVISREYF